MTIKYDRSASSIVVICTECPWWRALALSRFDADKSAEGHEMRVHSDSYARRDANAHARARHAADS